MNTNMIFEEAKRTNLVTLLASLGFNPVRISKQDYWYLSPFRKEHTASFKVNRQRNIFYDHGEGKGGNVIDFASRYFGCDAKEAAQKLMGLHTAPDFLFHQPIYLSPNSAGEKKEKAEARIILLDVRPLQNSELLYYLDQRNIPSDIARQFCKEVDFSLHEKQHKAIGFENKSGGFELRSDVFKGSSSPKDISFFDRNREDVCVFEGFFDFLSYAAMRVQFGAVLPDCLVLNSLAFLEKSRSLMERYDRIYLFLDQDHSGRQATQKAHNWNENKTQHQYIDSSSAYKKYKDLNEWWQAQKQQTLRLSQRRGLRL